jgi:competence protein ComEA
MNLNTEPIKNWFGFTRRERRSTFVLLILILLIIGYRYTVPESRIDIKVFTDSSYLENRLQKDKLSTGKDFLPDPGTEPNYALQKLGPASDEAKTLMSHRNKENKFKQSFDFKRDYRADSSRAEKLKQFVEEKRSVYKNPAGTFTQHQSMIDINQSDSATLVRLPGIGPVLSVRIIKYRRLLGGYARIEQLKEVYGLSAETFDLIKDRVFADSAFIKRININSAGYKELSRFPYLEKYEVTAILKYREIKGRIVDINDLTENKLITQEKAAKIGPYMRFE